MGKEIQIGVRCERELVERIDRYAQNLAPPGVRMTRSDAVRALVIYALTEVDRQTKQRRQEKRSVRS